MRDRSLSDLFGHRTRTLAVLAASGTMILGACTAAPGTDAEATSVETVATDAPDATTTDSAEPVEVVTGLGEESIVGWRILLTNDDSMQGARENNSDGMGLYELRSEFCAAGADVVVIAPWAPQSGRGTAVTNSGAMWLGDPIAVPEDYQDDCADAPSQGAVFGLCLGDEPCHVESVSATPADTVKFALRGGLEAAVGWVDPPDLVVSGSNAGLNVSSSVNDSGTVGAAIAAVENRVPAVAFSTNFDASFGYPVENYRATARWGVAFLEGLAARGLLDQHHFAITVNYPDVTDSDALPATFVQVGTGALGFHSYVATGERAFEVSVGLCEGSDMCEETRAESDAVAVFHEGHIGVGAIDWDRTYGADLDGVALLDALRAYVLDGAPDPVS